MKKSLLLCCLLVGTMLQAQETINTLFYNLYRFPDRPPARRELILKDILAAYRPDLFLVCELVTEQGADRILETALQTQDNDFLRANFVPTHSDNADPLQQMAFYNRHKLTLIKQNTYPTSVRDINHYTFVLNTKDAQKDSVFLEVFVTHLKSSEGPANRKLRLDMADTFVKALTSLPQDRHVLLAGDFNFYDAEEEPAYQKMTDSNNTIVMVDPIAMHGKWHDNPDFAAIHTQATRTSAEGFGIGGATGGMDDRFDFILMSKNFQTNDRLSYLPGSYQALGNNGNCFNQRMDSYDCEGPYSLELRQKLHQMSDHTPIMMQLQTNKQFSSLPNLFAAKGLRLRGSNQVRTYLDIEVNPNWAYGTKYLVVYNSIGQILQTIPIQKQDKMRQVDVRALSPGFYFIALLGEKKEFLKFVKL